MGTNYYHLENLCPTCGHAPERRHIGKSSAGWVFSLRVYPDEGITNLRQWANRWADNPHIVDEYGTKLTPFEMLQKIALRQGPDGVRPDSKAFLEENRAEPGPGNLLRPRIDGVHCIGHGPGTWSYYATEFS